MNAAMPCPICHVPMEAREGRDRAQLVSCVGCVLAGSFSAITALRLRLEGANTLVPQLFELLDREQRTLALVNPRFVVSVEPAYKPSGEIDVCTVLIDWGNRQKAYVCTAPSAKPFLDQARRAPEWKEGTT